MKKLIIVAAQINLMVGDINGNADRIIQETERAIAQFNADLVVFPELAITGYPPEDLLLRPALYERCQQALERIIAASKHMTAAMIIGYPHKSADKVYNAAVLIANGAIQAHYAKHLLPNYTVFDEKRYFSPGGSPCVFNLKGANIGLTICEDLWHTGPAEQAVSANAELLISINASPFDRNQAHARETILIERTHETRVPIIYVNLVGGQDELVFDGGSMVINSQGQKCQQAPYFVETLMPITIEINPHKPLSVVCHPVLRSLQEEENIYQALVLGIRDYIKKNHFPGAIIGLSGGIDSALALALTVDAIGADKVTAIMMPSRFTAQMSLEDAEQQAIMLGVNYKVISIEETFTAFLNSLAPELASAQPGTTEENLQARIRGTLLMAISNKTGAIVISTGNKSEMSVGYATLYGDMAGGFAAIKDVYKTMVYKLVNYRNTLGAAIPQRVVDRPPSAELSPGQLDQDSLPPYPLLDQILQRYIELDQAPELIYSAELDKTTVDKIVRMVIRNEYKRRQAPIGIRTTQRAFGKDRRYPITSGYQ